MIKTVIVLCMLMGGEVVEHTYKNSLSDCLKSKRIAERNRSYSTSYQCIVTKAELEKNIDGSISITKIILE